MQNRDRDGVERPHRIGLLWSQIKQTVIPNRQLPAETPLLQTPTSDEPPVDEQPFVVSSSFITTETYGDSPLTPTSESSSICTPESSRLSIDSTTTTFDTQRYYEDLWALHLLSGVDVHAVARQRDESQERPDEPGNFAVFHAMGTSRNGIPPAKSTSELRSLSVSPSLSNFLAYCFQSSGQDVAAVYIHRNFTLEQKKVTIYLSKNKLEKKDSEQCEALKKVVYDSFKDATRWPHVNTELLDHAIDHEKTFCIDFLREVLRFRREYIMETVKNLRQGSQTKGNNSKHFCYWDLKTLSACLSKLNPTSEDAIELTELATQEFRKLQQKEAEDTSEAKRQPDDTFAANHKFQRRFCHSTDGDNLDIISSLRGFILAFMSNLDHLQSWLARFNKATSDYQEGARVFYVASETIQLLVQSSIVKLLLERVSRIEIASRIALAAAAAKDKKSESQQPEPQSEKSFRNFLVECDKLGFYFRGVERAYRHLFLCFCSGGSAANASIIDEFELEYEMIPSRSTKATYERSLFQILHDVYTSHAPRHGLSFESAESKFIRTQINGIAESIFDKCPREKPDERFTKFKMHAEMGILLHLRENTKIRGGYIGVGKDCCATCWLQVGLHNEEFGDFWFPTACHGKVYLTMATGTDSIDRKAAVIMRDVIWRTLEGLLHSGLWGCHEYRGTIGGSPNPSLDYYEPSEVNLDSITLLNDDDLESPTAAHLSGPNWMRVPLLATINIPATRDLGSVTKEEWGDIIVAKYLHLRELRSKRQQKAHRLAPGPMALEIEILTAIAEICYLHELERLDQNSGNRPDTPALGYCPALSYSGSCSELCVSDAGNNDTTCGDSQLLDSESHQEIIYGNVDLEVVEGETEEEELMRIEDGIKEEFIRMGLPDCASKFELIRSSLNSDLSF